MKQKDIALILVIVFVSTIISLYVSKAIFVPPTNRQQQVEVVRPISADFPQPDSRFFNSNALDPTKSITISQNDNSNPFKSNDTSP